MVQNQLATAKDNLQDTESPSTSNTLTSSEHSIPHTSGVSLDSTAMESQTASNVNFESLNGNTTTANENLDNMKNKDQVIYSLLDNQQNTTTQESTSYSSLDNAPALDNASYLVENELYPKKGVKARKRNDSTESVDTVDSSSSDEIFNSDYTDTVSSLASNEYLLKSSSESDLESQDADYVLEPATNEGYMSCSSVEMLDEIGADVQDDLKSENVEEEKSEDDPMLEVKEAESHDVNDFVHHSLSPIHENQILTVIDDGAEPRQYTKITDNIVVVDESFLFHSNTNLGDLEIDHKGKRATTMNNLHERSSFLDLTEVSRVGRVCQKALIYLKDDLTLGSLVSLNTATAKENAKDPMQSLSLIADKCEEYLKKANYMKNLIGLSLTITLLYIAIGSARNLQSSINHEGGVGVNGLAANFFGYVVGSMFSSSAVQTFHPRRCIIVNLLPNLLYIAANLYPSMWIMVPISLIQGLSLAVVSNATSTYITFLAKGYAEKTKSLFSQVSGHFFGTYILIYQSHLIIGNLIASFILEPPAEISDSELLRPFASLTNSTMGMLYNGIKLSPNYNGSLINNTGIRKSHLHLCGAGFCSHFDTGGAQFSVDFNTKILLFGVYFGCVILAIGTAVFLMEPLNQNLFKSTVSPVQNFRCQMSSLLKFMGNVKFLLLLPLLMYSTMQFAFVSAEFVKGYVTCPLGIHMIGYTMICFGICSSSSAYFCGLLNKYVGRIPFIIAACVLNLGCLLFMYQWQPTKDSLVPYFVVMGIWGISDGFWNTQSISLMGVIFPTKVEEAYAGLRMTQGLSVAIAFGYSNVLCMSVKIYITIAICCLSLIGYLLMEVKHRREEKFSALKFKQTTV